MGGDETCITLAETHTTWLLLQVEAMETEMAEELQREAEARNAVDEEDGEGAKPMHTTTPSLVLDEAAGEMSDGEKKRYGM